MTLTSWLTSSPEQPTDTTDPNSFASLVNKMNLAAIKADAENSYKEKYLRLRRQVESDTVHNDLRAEITSLLAKKTEYETKLRDTEKAKTSADMQVVALDLVLKDTNVYYKSKLETLESQTKVFKEEIEKLRKDKQDMRCLLSLHGIRVPAQDSTNEDKQTSQSECAPELTDDSDMDEADELGLDKSATGPEEVCPHWYNHGTCSRGGGHARGACELGAHPYLIGFGTHVKE
ncbi:hypothetical protein J4E83_004087 [Alternaria metachromatica]|uniref:uncharacterized protein n=1 Tax=Alternaria metachromatica TaxID=283354 RepID=UPI0020C1BC09|nr:uncharacterized protein J4E83_004087 [Alternaria metachromatica]KAI4624413.1 hypothetical protein J4E83_004087 [Alternaria metachromatica]